MEGEEREGVRRDGKGMEGKGRSGRGREGTEGSTWIFVQGPEFLVTPLAVETFLIK